MKIYVCIFAYNEEDEIKNVILGCKTALPSAKTLVIDDGSKDRTYSIAKKYSEVLRNPVNLGKGSAMKNAFLYLSQTNKLSWDDVICLIDGDGQHNPKDLPALVKPIRNGLCDVTIGKRNFSQYPLFREYSNYLMSWFAFMHMPYTARPMDVECGYRCMRWRVILKILPFFNADGYSVDTQLAILASKTKCGMRSVDIESNYYGRSRPVFIQGLKTVANILLTSFKRVD